MTENAGQWAHPPSLQRRVGGSLGHLSNHQAARLLVQVEHPGLKRLVVGHVSEKNNTPGLAKRPGFWLFRY